MGEPQYLAYPNLSLAQQVFNLASPATDPTSKQTSLTTLQNAIREHQMAPLYAYLSHPQTGKLNAAGEGGASLSPVISRQNTQAGAPSPGHLLRRTSSINSPSIVGVLGGDRDTSVELPWDEKLYEELKAENEKELADIQREEDEAVELPWDEKLYEELKAENEKELADIQREEDEAVEQAGETEIQNARGKRAELYARIGDKDKAIDEFEKLFDKTSILGTKIDIVLAIIRLGLFFDDKLLVKRNVDRAGLLVESGGDWDRRNRLKAYQGLHLLTIRAHGLAAPLLLDSLSTFTSTELCTYSSLVVYATLAGSVALPRRDFKTRVVDAPEIRAVFGSDAEPNAFGGSEDSEMKDSAAAQPGAAVNLTTLASGSADADAQAKAEPKIDFRPLANMIQALYSGSYANFFAALSAVETGFLGQDRYLLEHKSWYVREMRLRAYSQLLQSYKIVSLVSMADQFGVSVEWLDRDLAKFVAGKRLSCRIDRVRGVIETERVDSKNRQYGDVVQKGDQLITKLQKYGQVVRLRGSER